MNAGRIEQVGTPREVYETPATPFVADFIGKINVLPAVALGGSQFRVGSMSIAAARADVPAGTAVKLYLRPEDVDVHVDGNPPAGAMPARVGKIEFLGAFCLVGLTLDGAQALALVANIPRQIADRVGFVAGQAVAVTMPAEALRVLG
jgi:iron(III) transport system ATP-binding protein